MISSYNNDGMETEKKNCVSEKNKNLIPTVNIIMSYNLQKPAKFALLSKTFSKRIQLIENRDEMRMTFNINYRETFLKNSFNAANTCNKLKCQNFSFKSRKRQQSIFEYKQNFTAL